MSETEICRSSNSSWSSLVLRLVEKTDGLWRPCCDYWPNDSKHSNSKIIAYSYPVASTTYTRCIIYVSRLKLFLLKYRQHLSIDYTIRTVFRCGSELFFICNDLSLNSKQIYYSDLFSDKVRRIPRNISTCFELFTHIFNYPFFYLFLLHCQ